MNTPFRTCVVLLALLQLNQRLHAEDSYSTLSGTSSTSTSPSGQYYESSTPVTVSTDEIEAQLASLRSQVATQELQISQVKSQVRSGAISCEHINNACETLPARWFVGYESVIVQPIQSNTTGLIVETDNGYSHVMFPWQLVNSPRVELGREVFDDSLGWRVRFWQFRHGESFVANDANGLIPVGNEGVVGYLTEDGDITTGLDFIEEGTFTSSIRTDVIDWELQRKIAKPVDLYAGIRYGKIGQNYQAVTDQGFANAYSEFRGVGPTVALRFQHTLPLERLSLFANLRSSLLFGKKQFSVVDSANQIEQSLNAIDLRSFDDGVDSFAGNAEIQLGLRYEPVDWIALRVAIEAQHFTDVGGANPVGVFTGPDGGLATDSPMDDNLSFVGLSLGAEIGF